MKKTLKILGITLLLVMLILTNVYATEVSDAVGTAEVVADDSANKETATTDETTTDETTTDETSTDEISMDDYDYVYKDYFANNLNDDETTYNAITYGNMFVLANNYTIASQYIEGDVFIMAKGSVTLDTDAYITGNLFVIAPEVVIKGKVYQSVYSLATTNFVLEDTGMIGNDLDLLATDAQINGSGTCFRSFKAYVENMTVADDAMGYADEDSKIYYKDGLTCSDELLQSLSFERVESNDDTAVEEESSSILSNLNIFSIVSSLVILAIVFLVLNLKDHDFYSEVKLDLGLLKDVGFGILWMFGSVIVIIIAMITLIGIPAAIVALMIYVCLLVISIPVASIVITKIIMKYKKFNKPIMLLVMMGIVIVINIVSIIPYIGGLIGFILCAFGLNRSIKYILKPEVKPATAVVTVSNEETKEEVKKEYEKAVEEIKAETKKNEKEEDPIKTVEENKEDSSNDEK